MVGNNDQAPDLLGGILREMREKQNIGRHLAAEHAEVGLHHLIAIELGEKKPSIDTLRRLIRCYGVSADRIFYPEGYAGDDQLNEVERLAAVCTPRQRQLLIAFARMLLEQTDLGL